MALLHIALHNNLCVQWQALMLEHAQQILSIVTQAKDLDNTVYTVQYTMYCITSTLCIFYCTLITVYCTLWPLKSAVHGEQEGLIAHTQVMSLFQSNWKHICNIKYLLQGTHFLKIPHTHTHTHTHAGLKKVLAYAKISDTPFDQRSLIHREAWFPPCFVRQNQPKKHFFCLAIWDHFQTKMFQFETTSFHYFFPRILHL